ncbi:MAG: sodium:proline symporter, partial [Nitrospirae bacterium]
PNLAAPERGYMMVVTDHVPPALRGIVIAGFLAAFMSTVATQLNWGASYLIADFYRRFLRRHASERHYVVASRLATVLLVFASAVVAWLLNSIQSGWQFVLEVGAGTGAVYLLRWYWWRINAWSEISAMAAALCSALYLNFASPFSGSAPVAFAKTSLTTVLVTTAVWVFVTFSTAPEPRDVLLAFYRKVRPDARGWQPIAALAPEVPATRDLGANLVSWVLGCLLVYGVLLGAGKVIFGEMLPGVALLAVAALSAVLLFRDLKRRGREALPS